MSETIELKDVEILSIQLEESCAAVEVVVGSINIVPPGPQGPADPTVLDALQTQISAIYDAGSGGASGLLPDETAARIAGDEALADAIADVQTLAQVNQLNISEKADQTDLDTLQTTVTGQGITLAQKANQTALDSLTTVVSGKATPADITAAIAALVNGAPDALNTLAEIATALAGEQAQIADLLTVLALRVRVDAMQSLTLAQQLQARQNINAEQVGVAANLVANITPASIGAATAVQGAKADTALQSTDLAPVAFSGAYSDLAGLPTIPGLSSSTPAAPTTGGTAGTATTAARGDHAHPLPTSAQITSALLTGLATGSATAIAAADTLLQALAKLQAQASANAGNIAAYNALTALPSSGGVLTVDLSAPYSLYELTLTENITSWVFNNLPASGSFKDVQVRIVQNASAAKTVVSPATTGRTAGGAWVQSSTLGAIELLTIRVFSDGTRHLFPSGVFA